MGLTSEQLSAIQAARLFFENSDKEERYDGSLAQAIRQADEFTERVGMEAMVIRKKNRYEWVTKYYFDSYKYNGKIYYKTKVKNKK